MKVGVYLNFLKVSEFHQWNREMYCQIFVLTLDQRILNGNWHRRWKAKFGNNSTSLGAWFTFLIFNSDILWEILISKCIVWECFLFCCTFKEVVSFKYYTAASENCFLKRLANSYCNLYASVCGTKERTCKFGGGGGSKRNYVILFYCDH